MNALMVAVHVATFSIALARYVWTNRVRGASSIVTGVVYAAVSATMSDLVCAIPSRVGAAIAVVLLICPAAFFTSSLLGLTNYLVLQWFGVRLQAEFNREEWLHGPRGRWWAADAPRRGSVTWSLLRWVWPLTGWWSRYRWIARRP